MLYSKTTNGFYDPAIHGLNFPLDVVFISEATHASLMAGQAAGQVIIGDVNGFPILSNPPAPTTQALAASIRATRTGYLYNTDWTQGADSPLSVFAKIPWATYRQALRDVPQQGGFPTSFTWPTPPA